MMITSVKNDTVKLFRSLSSKKGRRELGLHLIEGERLVFDALSSGAVPEKLLVREGEEGIVKRLEDLGYSFDIASDQVMDAACDTDTPQGVCAAVRTEEAELPESFPEGLVVCLDRVQDPGNLGTVIRTADAMGAVGVMLSEGCADAYSPKSVRAAMGSTYHLPIWRGDLCTLLDLLKNQGFDAVCGHLCGETKLPPLSNKRALVIGNEANGVSDEVAAKCFLYRLPMKGRAESLNAAAAAAILIYKLSEE